MEKWISFYYLALITSVAAQTPCPGNSAITGYGNIADINAAMVAEASKIKGGASPKPPYIFTICPNTILNAKVPLTPLLSGAEFVCGTDGALSNSCTMFGGTNQVSIQNSAVAGYPLQDVTFKGITFKGSSQASIVGSASDTTTANFDGCSWTGFTGDSAIQINSTSPKAMTVAVNGGNVQNGQSNSIFSNDKGSLQINGLSVTGSTGVSGIVTSNGGTTSISNGTFASDNLQTVTSTASGGSLKVANTDVSGSGPTLLSVFSATGPGTTMDVNGTIIHDNTGSSRWNVINYGQGSTGKVQGSQILRNTGLQYGVGAVDGSTVTVADTTLESNSAASNTVSSLIYALNNSKIFSSSSNVTNNNGFTTYGFTGFNSFTQYDNTTFQGGSTLIAVFVDQNSKFGFKNILFNNVQSAACPPPNQREFLEDVGSKCFFRGPGACTGICGVVTNRTLAPSIVTTRAPVAPSLTPVAATSAPSLSVTSKPTGSASTGATTTPTQTSPSSTVIGQPPTTAPSSSATIVPGLPTVVPSVSSVAPITPTVVPVATTSGPTATRTGQPTTAGTSQPTFVGTASPTSSTSAPVLSTKAPSTKKPAITPASPSPVTPTKIPSVADKGSKRPTVPGAKKTRAPVHRTRSPRARKTRPPVRRTRAPKTQTPGGLPKTQGPSVRRTRAPKTKVPGGLPKTQGPSISPYPTYIVLPPAKPTPAPSKAQKVGKKGKKGKLGKKGKQASLAPIVLAGTAVPSPPSSSTMAPSPSSSATSIPTFQQGKNGKGGKNNGGKQKGGKQNGGKQKGGKQGKAPSAPFSGAGSAAPSITSLPTAIAPPSTPSVTLSPTISFAPFLSGVVGKGGGKSAKKGGVKGLVSKKVRPQYASKQKKGQITVSGNTDGSKGDAPKDGKEGKR